MKRLMVTGVFLVASASMAAETTFQLTDLACAGRYDSALLDLKLRGSEVLLTSAKLPGSLPQTFKVVDETFEFSTPYLHKASSSGESVSGKPFRGTRVTVTAIGTNSAGKVANLLVSFDPNNALRAGVTVTQEAQLVLAIALECDAKASLVKKH